MSSSQVAPLVESKKRQPGDMRAKLEPAVGVRPEPPLQGTDKWSQRPRT
jgi:hypothetical protein